MLCRRVASMAAGAMSPTSSPPPRHPASSRSSRRPSRSRAAARKPRKSAANRAPRGGLHAMSALLHSARAAGGATGRTARIRRDRMKILTCNSNRPLAEAISAYLNLPLTKASVRRFSDMEIFVEIQENVRGEDVFLIQSTSYPANDHLMELLIGVDALRRASARRITAVIPYYGYGRQDRKVGGRTPISAKLVANLITTAGADRVLTL